VNLSISYPNTAALGQNSRIHWKAKADATRKAKTEAHRAVLSQLTPLQRASLKQAKKIRVFYAWHAKPTGAIVDDDNMISLMKSTRDGIAQAIGIDDKIFKTVGAECVGRCAGGGVLITLEAVL
jgi:crossover junction endodeoxyribonuclease RusA